MSTPSKIVEENNLPTKIIQASLQEPRWRGLPPGFSCETMLAVSGIERNRAVNYCISGCLEDGKVLHHGTGEETYGPYAEVHKKRPEWIPTKAREVIPCKEGDRILIQCGPRQEAFQVRVHWEWPPQGTGGYRMDPTPHVWLDWLSDPEYEPDIWGHIG